MEATCSNKYLSFDDEGESIIQRLTCACILPVSKVQDIYQSTTKHLIHLPEDNTVATQLTRM